jgi:hypothetical protein
MAQFSRYKLAEKYGSGRARDRKKRVREMVKKLPTGYKDNHWKCLVFRSI